MPDRDRHPLPHRPRAWLFGVVVPVLVTIYAVLQSLAWWPRLPEPAATHWGPGGVDGVGSLTGTLWLVGLYGAVSLIGTMAFALGTGRTAIARRTALGLATGLATLHAGLLLAVLHAQLDVVDAFAAPDPDGRIAIAFVVALLAGGFAAALAGADPHQPARGPLPVGASRAEPSDGGDDDDVPWRRPVALSSRTRRGIAVAAAVLLAVSVGPALATGAWWIVAVLVLPVLLLLVSLRFVVEVGPEGILARATLGWPSHAVPASEVESADVVEVDPFGDFGGWGLRIAPDMHGTVGVVLRRGEAIRVRRSGGRRFVVTVDDAERGAALLNSYAERARSAATSGEDRRGGGGSP